MPDTITHLEPQLVWKYFTNISRIPRCSKEEKAIAEYIISVAAQFGLDYTHDTVGNIVVRKPGTPGNEHAPILVLQAHMDMVCEKDSDKVHDFSRDPIEFMLKGDWLYANQTTLGADNGIGVASMLAIMEDSSLIHGPLEFLITVDEETGMTGAFGLSGDLLKGRMIINVDSEEEGTVYIGCAGGGDTTYDLTVKRISPSSAVSGAGDIVGVSVGVSAGVDVSAGVNISDGLKALSIKVHGLKGGHSGVDIHEGRANANKVLIRALNHGNDAIPSHILISALKGGSKRNAISREAEATILLPSGEVKEFIEGAQAEVENMKLEFRPIDPGLTVVFSEVPLPDSVLDPESSATVLNMLMVIPHGVLAMSLDIPDLVETSTNLAIMDLEEESLKLNMSTRSSIKSALEMGRSIHTAIGRLTGAKVIHGESYPGWKPDLDSRLLKIVADVHEEMFGMAPEKKAIHAGLECGLIKEKFPGMDAVSIGPQIEHPHSPTERVLVPSVGKFYRYLAGILRRVTMNHVS